MVKIGAEKKWEELIPSDDQENSHVEYVHMNQKAGTYICF